MFVSSGFSFRLLFGAGLGFWFASFRFPGDFRFVGALVLRGFLCWVSVWFGLGSFGSWLWSVFGFGLVC